MRIFRKAQVLMIVMFLAFGLAACSKNTLSHDRNVPDAPTGVTATPLAGDIIQINWGQQQGLTYNIYWSKYSNVSKASPDRLSSAAAPCKLSLEDNKEFFFVVTAENKAGESEPSTAVSAVTALKNPAPVAPGDAALTPGVAEMTVSWTQTDIVKDATKATSYNIYWSTSSSLSVTRKPVRPKNIK